MAIALRDSFIDVHLEEAELTQHVLDVIKARPTGPERRAAIAYLRQIVHKDAEDIAHFRYINARARQVHLVDDRDDLEVLLHRKQDVGDGLRLDALNRIHHEYGAFARGEAT